MSTKEFVIKRKNRDSPNVSILGKGVKKAEDESMEPGGRIHPVKVFSHQNTPKQLPMKRQMPTMKDLFANSRSGISRDQPAKYRSQTNLTQLPQGCQGGEEKGYLGIPALGSKAGMKNQFIIKKEPPEPSLKLKEDSPVRAASRQFRSSVTIKFDPNLDNLRK